MTENHVLRFFAGLLAFFLIRGGLHKLGVHNGFLEAMIIGLLIVLLFAEIFGEARRVVLIVLTIIVAGTFIFGWKSSRPTAEWLRSRAEIMAPKNNFDPHSPGPQPTALVKVREGVPFDGETLPTDYNFDPYTGLKARDITTEDVMGYERRKGSGGEVGGLPRESNDSIILKPGQSRVIEPRSLTCGDWYDDRLVYVGDPVGGGCMEVWADGKRYMNCPEIYVDIPRKAKDWVLRNRTSETLIVPVSVTSAKDC